MSMSNMRFTQAEGFVEFTLLLTRKRASARRRSATSASSCRLARSDKGPTSPAGASAESPSRASP
jgi:hypothetical protein